MLTKTKPKTNYRKNYQNKSFKGQDLNNADFSNCDIRGADFTNANLTGANFTNAQTGLKSWWVVGVFIIAAIFSIISGVGAALAAYLPAKFLKLKEFSFAAGLFLFWLLTFLNLFLLIITRRKGIQKALSNLAIVLTVGLPSIAILGVIGNDNHPIFMPLRAFRSGSFIRSLQILISNPAKIEATVGLNPIDYQPTTIVLSLIVAVAGTMVMVVALNIAVVLANIISKNLVADLAIGGAKLMGAIATGASIAVDVRNYGVEGIPAQAVAIALSAMLAATLVEVSAEIAKRTLAGDEKQAVFRQIAVFIAALGGTSFRNANLTDANFTNAILKSSDLRRANTTKTLWRQAKNLELARTGDTILIDPKVRDLLITGDGYQKSYTGANIRGGNLISANLSYADLKTADISDASLQAACLDWANLTEVQAIGTDFSYAQMTGCSLENWNIDVTTKLNEVESKFVYLLEHFKPNTDDRERRPSSGEFQPGEFSKLFEEVLNTVDLIFRNGIDWQAFMSSFKQVQVENEDTELNIQSIENKGDGVVVVKVSVPEETNKEKIHSDFVQIYDETVRKLEEKYQAELQGKEGEIAIYKQQNENMMSFLNNIVPSRLNPASTQIQREKLVIINFSNGDLEKGFATVKAQIWSDGNTLPITFSAKLPPETKTARLYQQWHLQYEGLRKHYQFRGLMPRIKKKDNEPTNFSDREFPKLKRDFETLANSLGLALNDWLNSPDFSRVSNQLRIQLNPSNRVRLIVETEDIKMRKLPWHRWDFFRDYRLAEIALSNPEGNRLEKLIPPRDKIRILAILGSDEGINIEADRQFLESLPDAETVFLIKPTRQQLDKYLWDERGWDIFCFSGHSESDADGNTGCFHLGNGQISGDTLTIEELENALKNAIEKGLQLAIFNSCDGLGLGRQLAELHIPQIIVMREPVPDAVAQEFLKNFLGLFASGKSLYISVRQGREMLQGMEDEFPCASWLPVIYQNQAEVPKTWQEFCYNNRPKFDDLLARLQEAIEAETALTAEDKTDALEQVQILAELGANPPAESQKLTKSAIRMLRGISSDRPGATLMAEALENLLFVYL
jgi:uncharacterized protein YjbI with pentapeptide repeats